MSKVLVGEMKRSIVFFGLSWSLLVCSAKPEVHDPMVDVLKEITTTLQSITKKMDEGDKKTVYDVLDKIGAVQRGHKELKTKYDDLESAAKVVETKKIETEASTVEKKDIQAPKADQLKNTSLDLLPLSSAVVPNLPAVVEPTVSATKKSTEVSAPSITSTTPAVSQQQGIETKQSAQVVSPPIQPSVAQSVSQLPSLPKVTTTVVGSSVEKGLAVGSLLSVESPVLNIEKTVEIASPVVSEAKEPQAPPAPEPAKEEPPVQASKEEVKPSAQEPAKEEPVISAQEPVKEVPAMEAPAEKPVEKSKEVSPASTAPAFPEFPELPPLPPL